MNFIVLKDTLFHFIPKYHYIGSNIHVNFIRIYDHVAIAHSLHGSKAPDHSPNQFINGIVSIQMKLQDSGGIVSPGVLRSLSHLVNSSKLGFPVKHNSFRTGIVFT